MWYEALAMLTPAACGRRRRRDGGEGGVLPASPAPLRPLLGTALGGEPRPARDGGRRTGSAASCAAAARGRTGGAAAARARRGVKGRRGPLAPPAPRIGSARGRVAPRRTWRGACAGSSGRPAAENYASRRAPRPPLQRAACRDVWFSGTTGLGGALPAGTRSFDWRPERPAVPQRAGRGREQRRALSGTPGAALSAPDGPRVRQRRSGVTAASVVVVGSSAV